MSKKKNTLKDLDEFLKQQAAVLVTPTPLVQSEETPILQQQDLLQVSASEITTSKILSDLRALAKKEGTAYRSKFYDLILESLEGQPQVLSEDTMLINTLLYLKSGDNWKETIRGYWKNKQHSF